MDTFPRTTVGGESLSRMIIGTNWLLGWSHCTPAKDDYIKENVAKREVIADVIEVFLRNGVDTIMGMIQHPPLYDAIRDAEDRTGVECVIVSTPIFETNRSVLDNGFDPGAVEAVLDEEVARGARFCLPHQATTDALVDRCTHEIRRADELSRMIRERGMIPGLSTHMPETIVYADEAELDFATYISIYNLMGFMMPIEVDWVNRIIQQARKPVMTIKPMAAGQVRPLQGLTFVWNSIRDQDMVTVGAMSPKEAAELVEMSREILARRLPSGELQETRSKASVKA